MDAAIAALHARLDADAATLTAFHERIKVARARLVQLRLLLLSPPLR
jgi:hypothetical protein